MMTNLNSTNLNSVFSASVSLLNSDLSLDIGATIAHAEKVEKLGVAPAFNGSTSQGQTLSITDKKKLIKEILKNKFKNLLIGTACKPALIILSERKAVASEACGVAC